MVRAGGIAPQTRVKGLGHGDPPFAIIRMAGAPIDFDGGETVFHDATAAGQDGLVAADAADKGGAAKAPV